VGEQRHPIKVVVRRTGLSADVLRAWERRYGVIDPDRSSSGRRLYSDEDIERLRLLRLATLGGRSIGSVSRLSTEELERLVRSDEAEVSRVPTVEPPPPDPETAGLLDECRRAVSGLDAAALGQALQRAALTLGTVRLLDGVIVPLLAEIGVRWSEGEISVAHEHAASAVVRQVIGGLLQAAPVDRAAPVALFGTPSGERHELGSLMAAAAAAAAGWRVVYLGPDLPVDDFLVAASRHRPRLVALSLVATSRSPEVARALEDLRRRLPTDVALVVGGGGAAAYEDLLASIDAVRVDDLAAFRLFLERAP